MARYPTPDLADNNPIEIQGRFMNEQHFAGRPPVRREAYPGPRDLSPRRAAGETRSGHDGFIYEDDADGFNPLQLVLYIVRYRWLIASIAAVCLAGSIVFTLGQSPRYRATALLEIAATSAQVIQDMAPVSETADQRSLRNALEKLRSREMTRRVVHALGLADRADFLDPPHPGFSLNNLMKRALVKPPGQRNGPVAELPAGQRERIAVGRVRANATMTLLRGTSIISIGFSSFSPDYARMVANQLAVSYISQRLDQTSETSRLARQFVAEQVAEVGRKLEASERALVSYAKAHGITVTGDERSLIAGNIRSINDALSQAIRRRLQDERLVRQIEAGRQADLEQVLDNNAIQGHRSRIATLKGVYQQKLRTFKPGFPEMRELRGQITALERLLREDIAAIASGIKLRYEVSVQRESDLRGKLAELEKQQSAYDDKNIRYTILKREVNSFRSQYQSLVNKLNELGVGSEIRNRSASIVEYAVSPGAPYSPRLRNNLALALFMSALLAGAIVYILETLKNSFADPDQLERELNLPLLGVVPYAEQEKIAPALADPGSALSEAYRMLRTSIQFSGVDGAPLSLLVTSSEQGEGKSVAARKLAAEFGALGLKVLVIDADMRRPAQHRLAGMANDLGLSNMLTNTVPAEKSREAIEIMNTTPWPNVWLVSAGTMPPNPADLIASRKMERFVRACRSRFGIVIIDSPPVMGLADALLLSRIADATLFMVSAHQVGRKVAQNALRKIRQSGGHVIGAAFNKFRMDRFEYNYAYRYMNHGYLTYSPDGEGKAGAGPLLSPLRRLLRTGNRR